MIIAKLGEAIRKAIPDIVQCLKGSDHYRHGSVRSLSSLAAHRMYYHLSFDMLNNNHS